MECPNSGVAVVRPRCTTLLMFSSDATSHSTRTRSGGMPPPFNGSGASRVQRTTLSCRGSPEATPRLNGLVANVGRRIVAHPEETPANPSPQ